MNNYSYVTLLTDDSYIFGILLLHKSLKDVETQYPLKVLVTPNVSKAILNILNQLEIEYKIIELVKSEKMTNYNSKINAIFARNWDATLSKFQIFSLTEYDKIIYLDTDIMLLKNIDHLFDCPHLTSAIDGEYFNIWPNDPHFNAGILVIEPKEGETEKLNDFAKQTIKNWNKKQCIADQEILNLYYNDWINKPELHLNKYYDVFGPYIEEEFLEDIKENAYFIHFIGRKPWRAFNKPSYETYSEYFYDVAHNLIQKETNKLNWDSAKKELKLAVYGICKNEMPNVEKYVKCFSKADYLCILDTGSTDGTWEFLQNAQKEYFNLIIDQKIIEPWRYDEARNCNLALIPSDATMLFMVDLDEIIKEDNWVQVIKNAWDPLFLRGAYTYNRQVDKNTDAVIQQFVEYRIHNNSWHYKGVVHEQLCNAADSRTFFSDECIQVPIVVWHYPTNPNRIEYIELCERGVEEEPLNWLMHLQLAAEYEVHQELDKAIVEYRKILAEQDTLSAPEIGRCYASLGRALALSDKEDEGIIVLNKGITVVPDYGDNYFFLAEIYYKQNKFKEVYETCKSGLEHSSTNYWCTIINCNSYFPYLLMGIAQYNNGNAIEGLGYLSIAREKNNNKEIQDIFNQMMNTILNKR